MLVDHLVRNASSSIVDLVLVCGYAAPVDFRLADRDLRIFRAYLAHFRTVAVLVRSPDGASHSWQDDGIVVGYVPRRGPGVLGLLTFWIQGMVSVWRWTRRYRLAVADASDLAGAFVLIPIKWFAGVRMLLHLQFQFFEMSPSAFPRWKRWAFRVGAKIACRYADSIRCVSQDIRQQALRAGVDPGKLVVIPARADTALFDPAKVPSRPAGQGRDLLYVGSLARVKGVDILLRALQEVVRRFPEVRLRLVGDGPEREALKQQADRTNLSNAVEFLGSVHYSAIPEILGTADVFVFPSLSEAMGRAMLEAMAMERPVVASRVGGIAEAVRDGKEGFLVPSGDPRALATAVCRILDDPALARELGRQGRRRVLESFSFEENVRSLVAWHMAWAEK